MTIFEIFRDRIERAVARTLRHVEGEGFDPRELDGQITLLFKQGKLESLTISAEGSRFPKADSIALRKSASMPKVEVLRPEPPSQGSDEPTDED